MADLSPGKLAKSLSTSINRVISVAKNKNSLYGSFPVIKADGSNREITPPKRKLKVIQEGFYHELRRRLVFSKHVHGGISGRDIETNARPHVGKDYVLNLDISKFFPSTKPTRVITELTRLGATAEIAELIADICSYKDELPQGSPSSVILGNIVLRPVDARIASLCKRHGFSYTRYIDDVTISGDGKLRHCQRQFFDLIESSGYKVHPDKIRLTHKSQQQIVTGLVVNDKMKTAPIYIKELVSQIKLAINPEFGIEVLAALHGLTPTEQRRSMWGRIQHIGRFDNEEGKRLKRLFYQIRKDC